MLPPSSFLNLDIAGDDPQALLSILKAAIMQSNEAILITDADLKAPGPHILFSNPAFSRLTGYVAEEVRGKSPRILQGPHSDRLVLQRLRRNLEAGESFEGETVNYKKDGTTYIQEWRIDPIRETNGTIRYFLSSQRDVTESRKAQSSANRLAAIVESSTDAVISKDLRGIVQSWNLGAEKIFGYTADEMVGTSITRIIPDERQGDEAIILGRIAEGKTVTHFETYRKTKDGRVIAVSVAASPIRDATGQIVGVSKSARDITEQKREEKERRIVEQRYRTLFDYAPSGILIAGASGLYIDANPSICVMLGYSREELLTLAPKDIVVPEQAMKVARVIEEMKSALNFDGEWQLRRRDRSVLSAEVMSTIMPDGNRLSMIRDVSERKWHQEQIAEQASFLDNASDAIIVRDLQRNILYWNKGAERMYGWESGDVVGRCIRELLCTEPGRFDAATIETIATGQWHGELHHATKDLRRLVVESRWRLFRDEQGEPKSILAINTDITEKKKIEAQFMRAQRMESIGTLAGGIAHDLNNILAPIMMSIELLKCQTDRTKTARILETIETSAKRGADIVRQVLSFARGMDGERVELQIKHLISDIESIIRDTFPKDIQLEFSVPKETWTIFADATQIHQVLLNLCVNARDAMPTGGRLSIDVENCVLDEHYAAMNVQAKPGRYVSIQVIDSGTGIPASIIDKIFEPFFTTKDVSKGTGLGLSTVMAIVKSHDGIVTVYSEPAKGTTFKVYLPASDHSGAGGHQTNEQASLPRGNGEVILVVDDEASVLSITSQTLQAFGYRVLTATDGALALSTYFQNKDDIALILTDMMMPVMDGPAFIHATIRTNPSVKIIAASGLVSNGDVAKVSAVGVRHFLTKPYTARVLLEKIHGVIGETAVP